MKRKLVVAALGLCLAFPLAAQSATEAPLTTFGEKLSYSIGADIGASMVQLKDEITLDGVIRGLRDAYEGKPSVLTPEEVQQVQQEFIVKMQAKQAQKMLEIQEKNKAFLAANAKKDGVVVTDSGLQYEIIKKGDGPIPVATDTVTVDYAGSFIDGTEFDSSASHGEKATFGVGQVIKGWGEALQLMPVGTKARLVIPAELAYGEKGAPPVVAPNSVLVFDVELYSIAEPAKAEEAKKE